MKNENSKSTIDEDELVLSDPAELFDEASEIAQSTSANEKFPFIIQYNAE